MSFAIKHGLFKLNIIDHHAILGVSLDVDAKQIRLRYLKIAQQLHPDTCKTDETKKQLASQLLSKLVNPAYEALSRKNSFTEHQLVLTQIGKHLADKKDKINLNSELARELLQAGDKIELLYLKELKNLANEQYKSLEQVTNNIALISELNLVYLMLKQNRSLNREESVKAKTTITQTQTVPPAPQPSQQAKTTPKSSSQPSQRPKTIPKSSPQATNKADNESTSQSRIDSYIRRAQQYIEKNEFNPAIKELRDALKIDPNHSTCHALLGKAYLLKPQLKMAKIHLDKAYQANPNDPLVIESKQKLEKLIKQQDKNKSKTSSNSGFDKKTDSKSKSSSGLFSSLFGLKKK